MTNSIEETELRTTVDNNKQTALNHDMEKDTAMTDSQNTNKCQERLDSSTAVEEYGTDDLFLNRKTIPAPKLRSWTTEDKETLPLVSCRHHRGDRVILLVLCLMCAAALGLSLLMLFGVLRPHCPPETKIGKNESPRCLCNFFPLISKIPTITANIRNLRNSRAPVYRRIITHVPTNSSKKRQPRDCYGI